MIEERLAGLEPAERAEHLERALASWRDALGAILAHRESFSVYAPSGEARHVIGVSFALGQFDPADPALEVIDQRDAFRAESLRLRGDAAGAMKLALASIAGARSGRIDFLGVLARASADLGDKAAWRYLDEAKEITKEGALLPQHEPSAVAAFLREKLGPR